MNLESPPNQEKEIQDDDSDRTALGMSVAQFHGGEFLGARILCFDRWLGQSDHSIPHPSPRKKG
jgi:hypothetical protein